jgi:hypothetical protein
MPGYNAIQTFAPANVWHCALVAVFEKQSYLRLISVMDMPDRYAGFAHFFKKIQLVG